MALKSKQDSKTYKGYQIHIYKEEDTNSLYCAKIIVDKCLAWIKHGVDFDELKKSADRYLKENYELLDEGEN